MSGFRADAAAPGDAVRQIHLLVPPAPGNSAARATALAVPPEPRHLCVDGAGVPRLARAATEAGAGVLVEAVRAGAEPRVLALRTDAASPAPRVNGTPMPPLGFWCSGDQVLVADHLLHVVTLTRPPIGRAGSAQAGKRCAVCRGTFAGDDLVYACPCGAGPVHWRAAAPADDEGEDEVLECAALLTECVTCRQPLITEERWDDLPDPD